MSVSITSVMVLIALLTPWLIVAIAGNSSVVSGLALLSYLALGLALWKSAFRLLMLLFPFYFGFLGALVSSFYLELGSYISEQEAYSYPTGATLRLATFVTILFASAMICRMFIQGSTRKVQPTRRGLGEEALFPVGLASLFLLLLIAGLAIFGAPIAMGMTRFEYWSQHPFASLWLFQIQLSQIAFLLGAVTAFAATSSGRRLGAALLLMILMVNIAYADKFSSNMSSILNFATAFLLVRFAQSHTTPKLVRVIGYGAILMVGFYILIRLSYIFLHGIPVEEVAAYIAQRAFALQGHTWWGIDSLIAEGQRPVGLLHMFKPHSEASAGGLPMLMYAIAPAGRVDWYLENGISFTMGGIALPVYALGYAWSIVYVVVAGALIGICATYIESKVLRQQYFRTLVGLKLMWIFIMAFSMGNLYLVFGLGPAVYLALIAFDLLVLRGRSFTFFADPPRSYEPRSI